MYSYKYLKTKIKKYLIGFEDNIPFQGIDALYSLLIGCFDWNSHRIIPSDHREIVSSKLANSESGLRIQT